MSKHNQMIGRRGEKHFSLLCSEAGVTCNKSEEDDNGWDKFIEFPPRPQLAIALDMKRGPVAALVQVKATEGESRTVQISLANALRYAGSSLPTFIVLVVLGADGPRYFAKHVWSTLIAAWLLAARQADAEGRTDTHRQYLSVTFDEGDEQIDNLLGWIEGQIAAVASPYAAQKTNLYQTIGFSKSRGTATFTLQLESQDDYLDLQLGLKPRWHANRFVFHSERFGISSGQPEIDLRDVQVWLSPEGRPARLRATFPTGPSITVAAKLFDAEDGDARAWRLVTPCLDIVFGPGGRIRAKAKLNAATEADIEDLALFTNLQATKPEAKVYIDAELNGRSVDLGYIEMQGQDQRDGWPWLGLSIDVVRQIASLAGKPLPPTSISAFNAATWPLEILCALASERYMRIDFVPERRIPRKFASMLAYAWAEIGDTVVAAVARRPVLHDKKIKGRRQLGFGAPRILDGFVVAKSGWSLDAVERAYARQLDIMAGDGDVMALGDLRVVASQGPGDHPLKSDLPSRSVRPSRLGQ
ncbi:hypothetical protein [Sphingosinicella sp.]|uniref:hypothetical protein n=1 Tax=Sphingosinicella sp. TaxID=1917971 RepID=UPI0035B0A332